MYPEDNMIDDEVDQELHELCVIEKSFDIDQPSSKRTTMIHRPKKHKHLFRYSSDISVACWLATVTNEDLLKSCGFEKGEIERMADEFPKLLKLNAKDMIAPKLRFLAKVLGGGSGDIGTGVSIDDAIPHNLRVSESIRKSLNAKSFFGSRLETAMGPRHAYLALHSDTLPHGRELLKYAARADSAEKVLLLDQFLEYCSKKPADFAHLCNRWQTNNVADRPAGIDRPVTVHTPEMIMVMDDAFSYGLLPFARNEITTDIAFLGCSPAKMVSLLLEHGANYAEHDDWGSTALHWAAGTGNLGGIEALIELMERDEVDMEGDARDVLWSTCASCFSTKDQATTLHWAAAGVNHTHFGSGGHVDMCKFLLQRAGEKREALANSVTAAKHTPLMWACWSGSLDVANFLIDKGRADPFARNEAGATCAHFAASAGHLDMCVFLQEFGLKFFGESAQNNAGQTPLDCANSYGRSDVVDWIASLGASK
jgi:hypothetical protein